MLRNIKKHMLYYIQIKAVQLRDFCFVTIICCITNKYFIWHIPIFQVFKFETEVFTTILSILIFSTFWNYLLKSYLFSWFLHQSYKGLFKPPLTNLHKTQEFFIQVEGLWPLLVSADWNVKSFCLQILHQHQ